MEWQLRFPSKFQHKTLVTSQLVTLIALRKSAIAIAAVSDGLKAWEVLKGRLGQMYVEGSSRFSCETPQKERIEELVANVWRRQASVSGGNAPREESDTQQKVEATAENNASSNHSSGYMACLKRNRECIEKGSDAQGCEQPLSVASLEAMGVKIYGLNEPNDI